MSVTSEAKGGWAALKSHWVFFLIFAVVLVGLAFHYDKKSGAISSRLASLPFVGKYFA